MKKIFLWSILFLSVIVVGYIFFKSIQQDRLTFSGNTYRLKDSSESLEKLKSLPYLGFVVDDPTPMKNGVIENVKESTCKGINLFCSCGLPGAYLIDMKGITLHEWRSKESPRNWHFVKMLTNGDLIVVIKDIMLMCLNWQSEVKWTNRDRFHHEASLAENGDIYSLTRGTAWIPYKDIEIPILNDFLTIVSADGKIKNKISFYELIGNKIPTSKLEKLYSAVLANEEIQKSTNRFVYIT